jgi:hypothetical protein
MGGYIYRNVPVAVFIHSLTASSLFTACGVDVLTDCPLSFVFGRLCCSLASGNEFLVPKLITEICPLYPLLLRTTHPRCVLYILCLLSDEL